VLIPLLYRIGDNGEIARMVIANYTHELCAPSLSSMWSRYHDNDRNGLVYEPIRTITPFDYPCFESTNGVSFTIW
jgi:hypothetical protein